MTVSKERLFMLTMACRALGDDVWVNCKHLDGVKFEVVWVASENAVADARDFSARLKDCIYIADRLNHMYFEVDGKEAISEKEQKKLVKELRNAMKDYRFETVKKIMSW